MDQTWGSCGAFAVRDSQATGEDGGSGDGNSVHLWVTQLAPALQAGYVIILDNLSSQKSPKAAQTLRDIGCWLLPLPPCSPNLNPIEMAFAKLKTLLRKAAARTYEDLWKAVGTVRDLLTEKECLNYFIAAGYKPE